MAVNKDFLVKNGLQVGSNTSITGSLTAAGLVYPVSDGSFKQAIVTDGSGYPDQPPLNISGAPYNYTMWVR